MLKKISLTLTFAAILLYGGWRIYQPVEIDAVHKDRGVSYASVLVRHFPWTVRGRIEWWEQNRERLRAEYGIPHPDTDGTFQVVFWAWDGIYRVNHGTDEDSDLRCFEDMTVDARCIEKSEQPLLVRKLRDGRVVFYTEQNSYVQDDESKEVRLRE